MTNPTPEDVNWGSVINMVIAASAALIGWIYFVHWYFKNKKQEKEDWIKAVATEAVTIAMNSCLYDVRTDIQTLFQYRESDRTHIDRKFETIINELRKP